MSKLFAGLAFAAVMVFTLAACEAGAHCGSENECTDSKAECASCPATGASADCHSGAAAKCGGASAECSDAKCCGDEKSCGAEKSCGDAKVCAAQTRSSCESAKDCSSNGASCPASSADCKPACVGTTLAATGAELVWGAQRFDGCEVCDIFAVDNELFALVKGKLGYELHCIELSTGVPRWLTVIGKTALRSRPTVSAHTVVCLLDDGAGMVVLKRRNGAYYGRMSTPLKLVPVGGAGATESTVFVTSLADNAVHAVSPTDGLTGWRWRTTGTMFNGPAMAQSGQSKLVVVGTGDGEITALPSAAWNEGQPASPAWTRKLLGGLNGELCTYSTTTKGAVSSAILASCDDHGLYCLDGASGTSRWVFRTDSPFCGKPQAAAGKAFAINGSGLHVLDLATGAELWTTKDGKPGKHTYTKRMLTASAKSVYLTCGEGIGRFEATTGALLGCASTAGVDFLVETGDAGLLVGATRSGRIAVLR